MNKELQLWYGKLDADEATRSQRRKIFYNVKGDFSVNPERPLKNLEEIAEITVANPEDYDRLEWAIQEGKEIFIKFFIDGKEILNDWFFVIGISGRAPAKKFKIINTEVEMEMTAKEKEILCQRILRQRECPSNLSLRKAHIGFVLKGRA